MEFYKQLFITSIGSFLGFSFALILFFLQNKYQEFKNEKAIVKNLAFEVEYNIHYLQKCLEQLNKCLEKITNDKTDTYIHIDYNFIGRYHTKRFYNEGLISKYFMPENVRDWNIYMDDLGEGSEKYISEEIEKWRNGQVNKENLLTALDLEKELIQNGIDISEWILRNIKSKID